MPFHPCHLHLDLRRRHCRGCRHHYQIQVMNFHCPLNIYEILELYCRRLQLWSRQNMCCILQEICPRFVPFQGQKQSENKEIKKRQRWKAGDQIKIKLERPIYGPWSLHWSPQRQAKRTRQVKVICTFFICLGGNTERQSLYLLQSLTLQPI